MIFLIAAGKSNSDDLQALKAASYTSSDFGVEASNPVVTMRHNVSIVTSHGPLDRDGEESKTVLWDGSVIDGDVAFSTIMPVQDAAHRMWTYMQSIIRGEEPVGYSGIFGCAQVSPDGSFFITTDQLSQYAFFYVELPHTTLVSNSLHLIEKTARLLQTPVHRDFASNAYEAAFGAGGWTRTGLAGVNKIPPGHSVQYGQGRLSFVDTMPLAFTGAPSSKIYPELMKEAARQLRAGAVALSRAFPEKGLIVDLSGGKDTRLLLASYLAENLENFHVFLGAPPGHPDYDVAAQIVHTYNLKGAHFPSNMGPQEDVCPIHVARRAAYRFMGTSSLYQSDIGLRVLKNVGKVRGGCAEGRTKAFFVYPDAKRRRSTLRYGRVAKHGWGHVTRLHRGLSKLIPNRAAQDELLTGMIVSRGKRGHFLFNRDFLKSAYHSVRNDIRDLQHRGISNENIADAYYIFDRGWRHGGFPVQVMNTVRSTFEPLNSLALLKAELALNTLDRQNARLTYDLFQEMNVKDLVEIPFETSDWPSQFFNKSQHDRRSALSRSCAPEVTREWITDLPGNAQSIHTVGRSNYMAVVKDYMLDLATDLSPGDACWDFMDRDQVLKSISNGTFEHPSLASTGIRLLHAFIWIAGEEIRFPFNT